MDTSSLTDHATAVKQADPDDGVPTGLDVWKRTIPTGAYHVTDDSVAEFVVRALTVYPVEGTFDRVQGTFEVRDPIETSRLDVTADAASVRTGSRMRDAQLRSGRYLAAEQHPSIRFVGEHLQPLGDDTYAVHGQLTIRDVTRPSVLHVTLTDTFRDGDDTYIRAVATADVDRTAFGVPRPEAVALWGLLVAHQVRVRLSIVAGITRPSA